MREAASLEDMYWLIIDKREVVCVPFKADYYADHGEDDRLSFEILNRKRQYARFIDEAVKITDDHLPEIRKDIEKVVNDTYKITFDGMTDAVKRSVNSDELKENLKGVRAA